MELQWLDFDFSEDAQGHGSFDAMAAAAPGQLAGLEDEVRQVLAWAHAQFGAAAPPDEGGEWDFELQGVEELATELEVHYDAARGELTRRPRGPGLLRTTLSLTLTGTPAFCEALRAEFGV